MAPNIPGYFWDEEKGKFFKIQANHKVPENFKYSRQAITEKSEDNKKRRRLENATQRAQTERIKRSRILSHPLSGASSLRLQIGDAKDVRSRRRQEAQLAAVAAGLQTRMICADSRFRQIHHIYRYPPTMAMILGTMHTDGIHHLFMSAVPSKGTSKLGYEAHIEGFSHRRNTSISCSSQGTIFCTTSGDHETQNQPELHIAQFKQLDQVQGNVESTGLTDLRLVARVPEINTIYCSAPMAGTETFMFGHPRGISLCNLHGGSFTLQRIEDGLLDVCCVGVQSEHVAFAGGIQGGIHVHDFRHNGSAQRLRHASTPRKIESLDQWRVLVAGYDNKMSIYDLRMPIGYKRPPRTYDYNPPSFPYLEFADYISCPKYTALGIDVSPSLGLIANATPDSKVQTFSISTGKLVQSSLSSETFQDVVTCIKIGAGIDRRKWYGNGVSEASQGGSTRWYGQPLSGDPPPPNSGEFEVVGDEVGELPSLLIGVGGVVQEWGWGVIAGYPFHPSGLS